jgi:hypothetical protein
LWLNQQSIIAEAINTIFQEFWKYQVKFKQIQIDFYFKKIDVISLEKLSNPLCIINLYNTDKITQYITAVEQW